MAQTIYAHINKWIKEKEKEKQCNKDKINPKKQSLKLHKLQNICSKISLIILY
jgi:hypothetical protein